MAIVPMAGQVAVHGDFIGVMWASPATSEVAGRAVVLRIEPPAGFRP
jgi:hypothetical protein